MARFVDEIAAAGKEIHPIPAYTNVWLDKQGMDIPGTGYPSGGLEATLIHFGARLS